MGPLFTMRDANDRPPVLVNRGWIAKIFALRETRPKSVDPGTTIIKGLSISGVWTSLTIVRAPPKANMFTPENDFAHGKFYSVNVPEMAEYTGSQPLLIEQTFGNPFPFSVLMEDGGLVDAERLTEEGTPIGRYPGITLRNAHFQYIVTWYALNVFLC